MRIYPELTVDEEYKALGDAGHTGSLNDRQHSFLVNTYQAGALADLSYLWRTRSTVTLTNLTGGEAREGDTIGLDLSALDLVGGETITYQWQLDGADIPGATTATEVIDITGATHTEGGRLRCIVTVDGVPYISREARVSYPPMIVTANAGRFDDIEGVYGPVTVEVFSAPHIGTYTTSLGGATLTQALVKAERFVPYARPLITGGLAPGQAVQVRFGLWLIDSAKADPVFTPQWQRDGVNISGATDISYTLVEADQGADITVTVTAAEGPDSVSATSLARAIPGSAVWGAPVVNGVGSETANLSSGGNAPAAPAAPVINSVGDGSANISVG